jgi:hypothetical protein
MSPDANRPQPAVSPDDLERERLRTYLDWGEVRAPVWYWPGLAFGVSWWLVGMGHGPGWSLPGAVVVMAVSLAGLRIVSDRAQVSMPRFRGMPTPLLRAYLPGAVGATWMVGVLVFLAVSDQPHVWLGAITGPLVSLAGASTSVLYRRAADRLATAAGLSR